MSCCVCCEACAFFVTRIGRCQSGPNIVAALPLVPYATNSTAWLRALDNGAQRRFKRSALPALYLDFFLWTYQRWEENVEYDDGENSLSEEGGIRTGSYGAGAGQGQRDIAEKGREGKKTWKAEEEFAEVEPVLGENRYCERSL